MQKTMIRFLRQISWKICAAVFSVLIFLGIFFPQLYEELLPFRFYNVLTDSMEPKIPTNSLVLVKVYQKDMELKKNDILTFRAQRFGEEIVITHRFSHTETMEDGTVLYRTHPEQTEAADPYETKQENILGVYLFHIPYAGKLLLFLKSSFGFLWICQVTVILLIKETVAARWKEKETCLAEDGKISSQRGRNSS